VEGRSTYSLPMLNKESKPNCLPVMNLLTPTEELCVLTLLKKVYLCWIWSRKMTRAKCSYSCIGVRHAT